MAIELFIPASAWMDFKNWVLSYFFKGDEPVLTKHNQKFDAENVYASFSSDCEEDTRLVISALIDLDGGYRIA